MAHLQIFCSGPLACISIYVLPNQARCRVGICTLLKVQCMDCGRKPRSHGSRSFWKLSRNVKDMEDLLPHDFWMICFALVFVSPAGVGLHYFRGVCDVCRKSKYGSCFKNTKTYVWQTKITGKLKPRQMQQINKLKPGRSNCKIWP